MSTKKPDLESRYANRRKKIIKQIKGEAAVFYSAPECTLSRDQFHPYRQNSDFLYLTGIKEPHAALVLLGSTRGPRSILFLRERNPTQERWTGELIGLKRAKRRFHIDEVRPISEFASSLPKLLTHSRVLHYAPGSNPESDSCIWKLFQSQVSPRFNFPHTLKDSRLLTSELRMVKDREEIRTIRHVSDITSQAFLDFIPDLRTVKSEKHGVRVLESHFARLGAEGVAFPTIIASGRNATVLHHEPRFQPLWKRELVLIDAGALFNGYAADLSRTLPVSGVFSQPQADVYEVVHSALRDSLNAAKPGSTLDAIHRAAVRTITSGLVDLGLLHGSTSQLIEKEAYKPYYMHRTSHWLGIDVHDISSIYCDEYLVPPLTRPLVPGNVITVEPGLYFDPKDKSLLTEFRGIGVRIEEDVLITSSGCEILTARMPTDREEIETLMARYMN